MESIVERIGQFIEVQGITKSNFSKRVGLSNGYLDKVKDVGSSKIELILKEYPNLNPSWLLTGMGEMILSGDVISAGLVVEDERIKVKYPTVPIQDITYVPLVRGEVIGGFNNYQFSIEKEDITNYIPYTLPSGVARSVSKPPDFAIRVMGDSMSPRYSGGDIVYCRIIKENSHIQWNRIYVVGTINEGLILKRVRASLNEGCLQMVSDHKDYAPFDIKTSDLTGMALVMGGYKQEW